jgi:hypothetical protein
LLISFISYLDLNSKNQDIKIIKSCSLIPECTVFIQKFYQVVCKLKIIN